MDQPFLATEAGLDPLALRRLCRSGDLRRLVRGVYVDASAANTLSLRARAVALVAHGRVAVGECAAWVHGILDDSIGTLEFGRCEQVVDLDGLQVAGLEETAVSMVERMAPAAALGVLDASLRRGARHGDLLDRSPTALVAAADARALDHDESALRWAWLEAGLPSARLGASVLLPTGPVRVALGLPERCFGAGPQPVVVPGWRVLSLRPDRLRTQTDLAANHLRLSYHRHLMEVLERDEHLESERRARHQPTEPATPTR